MFGIILILIGNICPFYTDILEATTLPAPANSVVLTFDDGPHPRHTKEILDILKAKDVKATFFTIGLHVQRHPEMVQQTLREGHTLGGHSYSHQNFSRLTLAQMAKEVLLPQIQLTILTGEYPKYFRFPYGVDDIRIRNFFGGKILSWNVDGYDWRHQNPKQLALAIISQTKTGSIILLHDIKGDTVKALPDIIDGIRAKHLEFAPLPSFITSIPGSRDKHIQFFSRLSTGVLHDHKKSKKPQRKSTEEILGPIVITEVVPW